MWYIAFADIGVAISSNSWVSPRLFGFLIPLAIDRILTAIDVILPLIRRRWDSLAALSLYSGVIGCNLVIMCC